MCHCYPRVFLPYARSLLYTSLLFSSLLFPSLLHVACGVCVCVCVSRFTTLPTLSFYRPLPDILVSPFSRCNYTAHGSPAICTTCADPYVPLFGAERSREPQRTGSLAGSSIRVVANLPTISILFPVGPLAKVHHRQRLCLSLSLDVIQGPPHPPSIEATVVLQNSRPRLQHEEKGGPGGQRRQTALDRKHCSCPTKPLEEAVGKYHATSTPSNSFTVTRTYILRLPFPITHIAV